MDARQGIHDHVSCMSSFRLVQSFLDDNGVMRKDSKTELRLTLKGPLCTVVIVVAAALFSILSEFTVAWHYNVLLRSTQGAFPSELELEFCVPRANVLRIELVLTTKNDCVLAATEQLCTESKESRQVNDGIAWVLSVFRVLRQ